MSDLENEAFYHIIENISSFWLWWQQHISKKLEQGELKYGKVTGTNKKNKWRSIWQLRLTANRSVTWLGIKGAFQRGRGSPICDKLRLKIVEQFQKNVNVKIQTLRIPLSTVHNIIQRSKSRCVNTVHSETNKCKLKLYCLPSRSHIWTWSRNKAIFYSSEMVWAKMENCSVVRLIKLRHSFWSPWILSGQFKTCISDGMGLHSCLWREQLIHLERHGQCWKAGLHRGCRATYAPIQTTSLSWKALHISAGQC